MNLATKTPLDVHEVDGALIARFSQVHVDVTNCDDIFKTLAERVKRERPQLLIVNLQRVSYFHSVAIGRLIELQQLVKSYGGELVLCGLNVQPIQILTITRVDSRLKIIDSEPTQFPICVDALLASITQPLLPQRGLKRSELAEMTK